MRKTASSQTCGWENWDSEGDIDQSRVTPPCQRGFDLPGPRFKFAAPALSYCLLPLRPVPVTHPGPRPLESSISFHRDFFFFPHWETPSDKAEFWDVKSSNHGCWDLFLCGEDQPTALKHRLFSWRWSNQTLSLNGARMSAPREWKLHLHCHIPKV